MPGGSHVRARVQDTEGSCGPRNHVQLDLGAFKVSEKEGGGEARGSGIDASP